MDQQRRRKRYHNKTLNGCVTCKQRKVKCDETQPKCLRCITSNYICAGYNVPQAKIFPAQVPVLTATPSPSTRVPADKSEHRAWSFFLEESAPSLAGFTSFTHVFWSSLIPQLSHSEPAVRYAAFAIALRQKLSTQEDPGSDELRASCVYYHTRAIQALTQASCAANTAIVLVCCIAFIAFERLDNIGTPRAQLMNHYDAGMKILKEHAGGLSSQRKDFDLIVNFIEPMFFQMSLIFNMFRSPQTIVVPSERRETATNLEISIQFQDLVQAKKKFHHICWLHCYLMNSTDPWLNEKRATISIYELLTKWGKAMDDYIYMLPDSEEQQKKKAADLKTQADVLWVAVEYSLRDHVPNSYCCAPIRIELRPQHRTHIYYQISADRAVNLVGINRGRNIALEPNEAWLWPKAKRLRGSSLHDFVLLDLGG